MIWWSETSKKAAVVNFVNKELVVTIFDDDPFSHINDTTLEGAKEHLTDEEYVDLQRKIFERLV